MKYKKVPLVEICDFLDNLRVPVTESDRKPGPYPYYGANGQQGTIDRYIFEEPLVLLAEDGGYFGSTTRPIAYKATGRYWVNNHAHVLKPKANCDIDFLFRVLSFYDVRPYINGSTREKLTKGNAEQILLPFPPLDEQQRIAQVLESADRLRRLRRHATQQTETFLQSVFIEMFGDPYTNPMGWNLETLDTFILDAKNGYSLRRHTSENIGSIVLRIRDVGAGWIDYSDVNRIALSEKDVDAYSLQDNDLLLIRVNGNPNLVGRAALFETQREPIAFNDHIIRVRLNTNAILPEFILQLLNSPYGRMKVRENVTTTAGQFTINRQGLANITFPLPPITKQQEFVKVMISLKRLLTSVADK